MAKRGRPATKNKSATETYLDKIGGDVSSSQSKVSMFLGALIVLVVGVLIFNYFNKPSQDLGPAQQIENTQPDVSTDNLPGKYTVKSGDTLFLIAEKYYKDGYKYTEIAKANNLTDVNSITLGQVLEIPKLETEAAQASPSPVPSVTAVGGGDTTIWGAKIDSDTYTVVEGDWLSTISARAYGDVMAYQKIAQANNISNPDLIYPGQVLKIPR